MAHDAGNTLLKTLEEPALNSLIILTSAFPDRIFSTVKSRCQTVAFFPLGYEALKNKLMKDFALKEERAHFLAHFAQGCLGRAVTLNDEDIFEVKNEAIDQFVYMRDSESYFKKIAEDKRKTKELLEVLLSFFRDLMLLKAGSDEIRLVHRDRISDLRKLEAKYSFEDLDSAVFEITRASKFLGENLNIKIALTLTKEKLRRG